MWVQGAVRVGLAGQRGISKVFLEGATVGAKKRASQHSRGIQTTLTSGGSRDMGKRGSF